MANALDAAMKAYDRLKASREHDSRGIPVDLDEEDVLMYTLIGIGQELAIANGIALASALDFSDPDRETLLDMAKSAIGGL